MIRTQNTYLLVADGELSLRLLILLGKVPEFVDGIVLQHRFRELDVRLGVFVSRLEETIESVE